MKGVILTQFLDWVESRFDEDTVDDVIESSDLSGDGGYTSVGVYPYTDLVALAATLAPREGLTANEVLRAFSRESFTALAGAHASLMTGIGGSLELLEVVTSHIHVEVLALYPDTQLPHISTQRLPDGSMELLYTSVEPLAAMCEGRIQGVLDLFDDGFAVECTVMDPSHFSATFRIFPEANAGRR